MDRRSEHRYGPPLFRDLFRARSQQTEYQPLSNSGHRGSPLRFGEGCIADGAKAAANDQLYAVCKRRVNPVLDGGRVTVGAQANEIADPHDFFANDIAAERDGYRRRI